MSEVIYKHKTGALHISGGRFFYANEPVEVSDVDFLLKTYVDLKEVEGTPEIPDNEGEENSGEDDGGDIHPEDPEGEEYTEASLKKLNAEEQKEVIISLGGNPEETNNADERIALILQLQEEQKETGE